MDPDELLTQIREIYNAYIDGLFTAEEAAEQVLDAFDELDNWLLAGGTLPREWQVAGHFQTVPLASPMFF